MATSLTALIYAELSQAHGNLVAAYLKTPNIFLVRQVLVPVCLQLAKACSNPNGTAPAINCSCLAHDMPAQKHFGHAAVPTPRLTACSEQTGHDLKAPRNAMAMQCMPKVCSKLTRHTTLQTMPSIQVS